MIGIGLVFDTETTGWPSEKSPCGIVQIAAILQRLDGSKRVLGEINFIVKPTRPITPGAQEVHGISLELAERFGMTNTAAEIDFIQLAQKADVLIAHNIDFDMKAVRDAWPHAYEVLLGKQQYCTMKEGLQFDIPKAHAGSSKYPKLSDAYRFFKGVELDGAHDAMIDARACRDVFFEYQTWLPRCITCEGSLNDEGGHVELPKDGHTPLPYPKAVPANG